MSSLPLAAKFMTKVLQLIFNDPVGTPLNETTKLQTKYKEGIKIFSTLAYRPWLSRQWKCSWRTYIPPKRDSSFPVEMRIDRLEFINLISLTVSDANCLHVVLSVQ